ncbi:MAG: DUF4397 domain-containing protein [Flavobacteriaceae bacterium]|nr:DUF4397 domain-containing protein [Flavobacteriaceae bacterium]MDG1790658.1 DUF4397 domain-containing protein [Flavobacteriaceae bacterium]
MKKHLLIIFLALSQIAFSQTLEMPNFPDGVIIYDVSIKNQFIDFSEDGDWDFSEVSTDIDSAIQITPISDSPDAEDYPNATHAKYEDGNILFLGFEPTQYTYNGEQTFIDDSYVTPLVLIPYPFNVGETHTDGVFNIPFTCSGCPPELYRDHEVVTSSLSSGSVTMPDGFVYNNVTLVKITNTFTDGQTGSSPCITTLEQWLWWAEGYAIPIVESRTFSNSGQCAPPPPDYTKFLKTQTARVQVIHNSADAAAETVDVYLNETLLIPNFEFRTASPFVDAPAGLEIELSVAPPNSSGVEDAIYTAPVTLSADETYIVVADGIVSGSGYNPPQPFGLQIYDMGRELADESENTDVLVHHGSTDAPTVDIVETGVGAGTLVDNISYTEFQGYLELPTADYIIDVTDETGSVTVASFQAPLASLELDGVALVAVATGFLDPSQNSDGPAFGIGVALPTGGPLVMLPELLGNQDHELSNAIALYPSPAKEQVTLSNRSNTALETAMIYDLKGKLVSQIDLQDMQSERVIDISSYATGVYMVHITGGQSSVVKRLIKE